MVKREGPSGSNCGVKAMRHHHIHACAHMLLRCSLHKLTADTCEAQRGPHPDHVRGGGLRQARAGRHAAPGSYLQPQLRPRMLVAHRLVAATAGLYLLHRHRLKRENCIIADELLYSYHDPPRHHTVVFKNRSLRLYQFWSRTRSFCR